MCTLLTEGFFSAVDVCKGRRCEERAHCAKNVTILTFGASQECGNLPCLSLFLSCVFRCHCVLTFPNCPAWCLLSSRNVCFCALQLTASAWTPSLCHFSASGLEPRSGPLLRCWAGAATQVWCQWPFFFFTSPSSPSSIITLCSSSVLRSRLRHVWGGLVQSQLLHHSQVLHHLHPHLLLFHPRDDHALLLRLHHKNGEEHQRHVSWRLSHPTPEEGGERRHQGGFQFYISVLKSCTSILPTPVPYCFPLILA